MLAGFQVPVMPLTAVDGSTGTELPEQTVREVPKLNEGVTMGFTVTVKVAAVAHCPGSGVKV